METRCFGRADRSGSARRPSVVEPDSPRVVSRDPSDGWSERRPSRRRGDFLSWVSLCGPGEGAAEQSHPPLSPNKDSSQYMKRTPIMGALALSRGSGLCTQMTWAGT